MPSLVIQLLSAIALAMMLVPGYATPIATPGLSVPDLISLTRFGSDLFGGDDAVPSPDRAHTAVVVQKGILRDNSRQFSLLLFANEKSDRGFEPDFISQFVTGSNEAGISQVVWLSNHLLAFLGEGLDAKSQVYTVDIHSRRLVQLTHAEQRITMFSAVSSGQVLVYATERMSAPNSGLTALRAHGFVVPLSVSVTDVIAGKWEKLLAPGTRRELHIVQAGKERIIPVPDAATFGACELDGAVAATNFVLAPSGSLALLSCLPNWPRVGWAAYQDKQLRATEARGGRHFWWVVLNMQTGEAWPLTGGPRMNLKAKPRWASDSHSVILIDDLLPLDGLSDHERLVRTNHRYTAEVDVRTRATTLISSDEKLAFKDWDSETETLTLQSEGSDVAATPPSVNFRKTPSGWTTAKSTQNSAMQDTLQIQEGLNEPWKLVRVNSAKKTKFLIYDPNAELFATRRVARETLLRWKTKSGAEMVAGLYWPLAYKKGQLYPMLIQTHGFEQARTGEEKFAPDGHSTTGYAAQPLAAAGVAVIQADRCEKYCDTQERNALSEGQKIQEEWESLIDRLDELGIVDRRRVGLQGYSRSCYHELYFMTHSSYLIAGMTCADGVDGSYLQYLLYGPNAPSLAKEYDVMNDGPPFGSHLKTWLERAPGFNLDHIHAPVQLTALTDGTSLLTEWEPYAGLLLQGKPAELVYLPEAAHNIERPWERLSSQQGAVDWFRFWLQDYERTEPIDDAEETSQHLAEQYARWHKLRDLQQADFVRAHANAGQPN